MQPENGTKEFNIVVRDALNNVVLKYNLANAIYNDEQISYSSYAVLNNNLTLMYMYTVEGITANNFKFIPIVQVCNSTK